MSSGMPDALRAFLSLSWRWPLRTWLTYVALTIVPALATWRSTPSGPGVADQGYLLMTLAAWLVVMVPAFVVIGLAWAAAVCLALRVSRGGRRASAVASGVVCVTVVVVGSLVLSDPRPVDLAGYGAAGVVLGAVAAWLTWRDTARIGPVSGWIDRLTAARSRREPAPGARG
ncbi:hypothetical protein [Cellulomonas iranensis]|uniref:hypothetical protein n=1 Tax=Cellulomonas iranensis TaxID=76862 RepID=UPI0013D1CBB9|nr:hypothetical protein [Cellulomonas iranensis]